MKVALRARLKLRLVSPPPERYHLVPAADRPFNIAWLFRENLCGALRPPRISRFWKGSQRWSVLIVVTPSAASLVLETNPEVVVNAVNGFARLVWLARALTTELAKAALRYA